MTRPHYIKRPTGQGVPSLHVCVDCEAWEAPNRGNAFTRDLRLRLWEAAVFRYEGGRVTRSRTAGGATAGEFWSLVYGLASRRRPVHIWSHNAFVDATWLELWEELDRRRLRPENMVVKCPPFIVEARHRRGKVVWVDLLNWYRVPLEEIGRSLGIEKTPLPPWEAGESVWREHCRRDVEILTAAVQAAVAFVREHDLGKFSFTVSRQAYEGYMHRFAETLPVAHGQADVALDERAAYYGPQCWVGFAGRVEPWGDSARRRRRVEARGRPVLWDETAFVLDVNSLYPSVMRGNRYPWRYAFTRDVAGLPDLQTLADRYELLATVRIKSRESAYPVRTEEGVRYAVGDYWTWLPGPELRRALTRGEVADVGRAHCYHGAEVFTGYVDYFHRLKKGYHEQGNACWRLLVKMLLNSLYGYFGKRVTEWRRVPGARAPKRWGHWPHVSFRSNTVHERRAIAGVVEEEGEARDAEHALIAVPAYVTSYARVRMQELIALLPPRTLLYTDTDSIHCLRRGMVALDAAGELHPTDLGRLKLEEEADSAEWVKPKVYRIGRDYTVAGKPRDADELDDWEWVYEMWERFDSWLDRGPDGTVRIRTAKATIDTQAGCGAVDAGGWTRPLEIVHPASIPAGPALGGG